METRPRCLPHRPASRVLFLSLALGLTFFAISATAGPPPPPGGHIPTYFGGANQAGYPPGTTAVTGTEVGPVPPLQDLSSSPNPFSGVTTVAFTLGQGGEARLRIFNLAGRQVREFVQRTEAGGRQQVRWDGRDEDGNRLASGIYFYQVESGKLSVTRKLVLMR